MSKFTLEITADNDAFFDSEHDHWPNPEIARILQVVARQAEDEQWSGVSQMLTPILDDDGNAVGWYKYEGP